MTAPTEAKLYSALHPTTGERVLLPAGKAFGKDGSIVDTAPQRAPEPGFRKLDEVTVASGAIHASTYFDPSIPRAVLFVNTGCATALTATEFRALAELCEHTASKLDAAQFAEAFV